MDNDNDNNFVDIIGYEGKYEINRKGDVRRKGTEHCLAKCNDDDGYPQTSLHTFDANKTRRRIRNHRLVALQFIPNPENKPEVDHIDRNRQNNHVSNLRWVTHQENQNNKITTIVLAEGQTMLDYKKQRRVTKIYCQCGGKYTLMSKARHFKTTKHVDYMATQNVADDTA